MFPPRALFFLFLATLLVTCAAAGARSRLRAAHGVEPRVVRLAKR